MSKFCKMSNFWILVFLALLLLCLYIYTLQFSYRRLPPGPFVIPILGSALGIFILKVDFTMENVLNHKAYEYFHLASKKYGGIFTASLGKWTGVVICSYDILKEIEHTEEYSMKMSNELTTLRSMGEELGLVFAATPKLWVEMRKFSQRALRDFGFGKRLSMQGVIEQEITEIVQEFQEQVVKNGGVIKIRTNFILSVLNTLWCMIAGQRYDHDDPKLLTMLDRNFAMSKAQTFIDPLVLAFPWMRKWFPTLLKMHLINKSFKDSHEYSLSLIQERKAEGAYLIEPQNYIDCFLKKIDENDKDPTSVYSIKNLQMMIEDFMQTGSTTSVATLNYAILFLTLNQDVQAKCQEEIDSIVSPHLVPTMDELERMPFFQATILETHRRANVVPIPVPRQIPKDWNYKGYFIPAGMALISNHYSVHMDEDYWGDPDKFRPSRFINQKGEFVPDKRVIHFGLGKRYCIGATLANSVIPIYISTLLQKFNFSVIPGTKAPTLEPEVGVSLSPKEFSVKITPRLKSDNSTTTP